MVKKVLIVILFALFFSSLCLAETTFFEGELGYNDEFIMSSEEIAQASPSGGGRAIYCGNDFCDSGETCDSCSIDCGVCISEDTAEESNKQQVCDIIFQSLVNHIKTQQTRNYTSEEIQELTAQINQKNIINFSDSKTEEYVNNYEDICERFLPLFAGLVLGRNRNLILPIAIIAGILVLSLFVYIFIKIFFWTKRKQKKVRIKKKKVLKIKRGRQ
ncbi:MAG: hypothetical protein PHQ66_01670 [Candidatus Nanoarchaeia archaeon]|nr:hypothetical protein [Candidatus Nanoarchaeia archaeon]MDD5357916.1 hypothetical protein [Candidatus Nanoarchaeia archaeon]MDD5588835.1 hypothetical protein [Candidatus Nanoarchaeia archaeon]